MTVLLLILANLALAGVTMTGLHLAMRAPSLAHLRIREEPSRKLVGTKVYVRMALNSLFSMGLVLTYFYGLRSHLFYEATPPAWRIVVEPLGLLLVYDFAYYFLHRFPFHQWTYLKRVHAIHHTARYPIAIDSLFLHPVENFLGLTLLFLCTWAVGPIHVYSFGIAFFVYSQLNVIVHGGLEWPGPFRIFSAMSRKHDKHHESMRGQNFASLTPLPDLLFRTLEPEG